MTPAEAPDRHAGPPIYVVTPRGEAVTPFLNPFRVVAHLWSFRRLAWQLTQRELAARYRGSFLGTLWSLLVPLTMLVVYTFVFSVVFHSRWGVEQEGHGLFALTLLAGLTPFNVFSEVVATSPAVVLANPGYVKRVVFPLEVLPLVRFLASVTQGLISALVLVLGILVLRGTLPVTLLLMPIAWLPLLLIALGAAYVLSALGVFVRDIGQAVTVVLPLLFFLSPIIYPIEAVPPQFRFVTALNPIAHVVEDCRRVAIFGLQPDWKWFVRTMAVGCVAAFTGFLVFMKSKRAFHDAL
jgi:lipopolysaccharide transport system permease protein